MKSKYMFFVALMFVACIFGGCSSAVSVGMSILPDGTIRQTFSVVLDANELSQKYTTDEIEKIYNTAYKYLDDYKNRVVSLAKKYSAEKGMGEYRIPWKAEISPSKNNGMTQSGQITCYVQFYNSFFYDEYLEYIGSSSSSGSSEDTSIDEESSTKKGWLFDTIIFQDTTLPVADLEKIQSVYDEIKTSLSSQGVALSDDVRLVNLSYDYAVPYTYAQVNRIRSNADKEYVQSEQQLNTDGSVASEYNMKHYVWNYNPDGENRLVLYRYRIHAVAWYLLALALVGVFGIIMLICHLITKKKGKRSFITATSNICENAQCNSSQSACEKVEKPTNADTQNKTKIDKMNTFFENINNDNKNNPQ